MASAPVLQAPAPDDLAATAVTGRPRWSGWFGTLALISATNLVLGLLLLRSEFGEPVPVLIAATVMTLSSVAGVAAWIWRQASRSADVAILDAELRALAEQETEERLHTLQIEYRDIFMCHPTPMWIFEPGSLRIVAVNDAACVQYGYNRAEFLRMTVHQLRPESEQRRLEDYVSRPRKALQNAGIWKHRRRDGSLLDAEIISHQLTWHGRSVRIVTSNDVTQRLAAERRLNEMNAHLEAKVQERTAKLRRYSRRLHARKRELEMANRDLEMFSYSASHDLRTPLWVMSVFVDLLLRDSADRLPPDVLDQIHKIEAASRHMKTLVDDLMKLAKVSKQAVNRSLVDMSAMARAELALLREREPARQVHVEVQPGMQAAADTGLLAIVLENLLGNAWKYSAYVPHATIRVGRQSREGQEVFFVRDDGAGFDMEDARDLFKPFRRMHGADKFEGTGIGLAIVQRIVALHGGRLWAEAEVGKGATFYFTLGSQAQVQDQDQAYRRQLVSLPGCQRGIRGHLNAKPALTN